MMYSYDASSNNNSASRSYYRFQNMPASNSIQNMMNYYNMNGHYFNAQQNFHSCNNVTNNSGNYSDLSYQFPLSQASSYDLQKPSVSSTSFVGPVCYQQPQQQYPHQHMQYNMMQQQYGMPMNNSIISQTLPGNLATENFIKSQNQRFVLGSNQLKSIPNKSDSTVDANYVAESQPVVNCIGTISSTTTDNSIITIDTLSNQVNVEEETCATEEQPVTEEMKTFKLPLSALNYPSSCPPLSSTDEIKIKKPASVLADCHYVFQNENDNFRAVNYPNSLEETFSDILLQPAVTVDVSSTCKDSSNDAKCLVASDEKEGALFSKENPSSCSTSSPPSPLLQPLSDYVSDLVIRDTIVFVEELRPFQHGTAFMSELLICYLRPLLRFFNGGKEINQSFGQDLLTNLYSLCMFNATSSEMKTYHGPDPLIAHTFVELRKMRMLEPIFSAATHINVNKLLTNMLECMMRHVINRTVDVISTKMIILVCASSFSSVDEWDEKLFQQLQQHSIQLSIFSPMADDTGLYTELANKVNGSVGLKYGNLHTAKWRTVLLPQSLPLIFDPSCGLKPASVSGQMQLQPVHQQHHIASDDETEGKTKSPAATPNALQCDKMVGSIGTPNNNFDSYGKRPRYMSTSARNVWPVGLGQHKATATSVAGGVKTPSSVQSNEGKEFTPQSYCNLQSVPSSNNLTQLARCSQGIVDSSGSVMLSQQHQQLQHHHTATSVEMPMLSQAQQYYGISPAVYHQTAVVARMNSQAGNVLRPGAFASRGLDPNTVKAYFAGQSNKDFNNNVQRPNVSAVSAPGPTVSASSGLIARNSLAGTGQLEHNMSVPVTDNAPHSNSLLPPNNNPNITWQGIVVVSNKNFYFPVALYMEKLIQCDFVDFSTWPHESICNISRIDAKASALRYLSPQNGAVHLRMMFRDVSHSKQLMEIYRSFDNTPSANFMNGQQQKYVTLGIMKPMDPQPILSLLELTTTAAVCIVLQNESFSCIVPQNQKAFFAEIRPYWTSTGHQQNMSHVNPMLSSCHSARVPIRQDHLQRMHLYTMNTSRMVNPQNLPSGVSAAALHQQPVGFSENMNSIPFNS